MSCVIPDRRRMLQIWRSLRGRLLDKRMRRVPVENFRRLHQRFRQRRVRMNAKRKVFRCGAHFDGDNALCDEFAGARASFARYLATWLLDAATELRGA